MKNVTLGPPGNPAELLAMIDEAGCTNSITLRREGQLSEHHVWGCAINHSLEKIITDSLERREGKKSLRATM